MAGRAKYFSETVEAVSEPQKLIGSYMLYLTKQEAILREVKTGNRYKVRIRESDAFHEKNRIHVMTVENVYRYHAILKDEYGRIWSFQWHDLTLMRERGDLKQI